jgi:hypothetical protein
LSDGFIDDDKEAFERSFKALYPGDAEFRSTLRIPQVSYRMEHKISGQITADNPISKIDSAGKNYLYKEDGNSFLDNRNYFCIEIYEDERGKQGQEQFHDQQLKS